MHTPTQRDKTGDGNAKAGTLMCIEGWLSMLEKGVGVVQSSQ